MNRNTRHFAARIVIWLIVAMLIHRVGACSCHCVRHSIWFEMLGPVNSSGHECDHSHVPHSRSHDLPMAAKLAISDEHCIRLSDNADLWRPDCKSNDDPGLDGACVDHVVADSNFACCVATRSIRSARPHTEAASSRLGVRAVLQVFQL
jgi:hypothetical protein